MKSVPMSNLRVVVSPWLQGLVFFLVASAIYLYAFPQANVFYAAIVLLHAAAGVVATLIVVMY